MDKMKKVFLYSLIALVCSACGGEKEEKDEQQAAVSQFRAVKVDDKYELTLPDSLKYDAGSRYFSELRLYISWPELINGKSPEELQKKILEKAFGEEKQQSLEQSIAQAKKTPIGYEDIEGVTQKIIESIPKDSQMTTSTFSVEAYPNYMSEYIYSYFVQSYFYPAGAAHGVGSVFYINYDVDGGKVISIDKLFKDMPAVKKCIDRELSRKQQYMGYLLVDEVPDPENFYIDGYTITFVFNPYEVAAYAAGTVTVEVPVYELIDYMTDYAKKLFETDKY